MVCPLKQPTITAEAPLSDDIEKLVSFVLHGVTHMLADGNEVQQHYFVECDDNVIIVNSTALPYPDMIKPTMDLLVEQHAPVRVACVSEAWMLPEHLSQAQRDGTSGYASIAEHPSKFSIVVLTVETSYGTWVASPRIDVAKDGTRSLPGVVHLEMVDSDASPYPGFLSVMPQKAPAGILLH